MNISKELERTIEVIKELSFNPLSIDSKTSLAELLKSIILLQKDWDSKKITQDAASIQLNKIQKKIIQIFKSSSHKAVKTIVLKGVSSNEIIDGIQKELRRGKALKGSPVKTAKKAAPKKADAKAAPKKAAKKADKKFYGIGVIVAEAPASSSDESFYLVKSKKSNKLISFLDNINPFKKKNSFKDFDIEATGKPLSPAIEKHTSKAKPPEFIKSVQPPSPAEMAPQSAPVEKHTTRAKPPMPQTTGAEPPPPAAEGKILYDIPDTMIVNQSQKCIVRIGETEAIIRDDDVFNPGVQVENVKLSNKMQVELIDISDPPKFRIKTFSAAKQFLEEGGYTEWIFTVTPLENGTFPLYLKVSVIKIINGEEVPREIVFEKSINITMAVAAGQGLVMGTVINPSQPQQNTAALKDLSNETKVVELPTPKIFISYAHNDKIYFDIFLSNFKSQSGWDVWTDRNIEIGANWFNSIQQSMQQSDCAVLLISSDFISSAFIKEHEFQKFSELKESKPSFIFLPILLRDCNFTRWEDLSKLQMFSALGSDYNVASKATKLMPFADLCSFFDNGLLKPNPNIDTYFKNLVAQANKQWVEINRPAA